MIPLAFMCSATYKLYRRPLRITCVERISREIARRWLEEHTGWFAAGRGAGSSPGGAMTARITAVPLDGGEATVKYDSVPLVKSIRYALCGRPARAHKAFRLGLALAAAGVRTPFPLALIEHLEKGLVRWSFLVLETIEASSLREFLQSCPPSGARGEESRKRKLWDAVAKEVAALHAARFRQRDLKAPNILVRETEAGDFLVSLIDLDGMTRLRAVPSRRVRVRDLARLLVSLRAIARQADWVSDEDWSLFLTCYLERALGGSPSSEELEGFLAETRRWARRKERRNRRRGRPLT